MQKISFEPEDFPPPSYYLRDGLDDEDEAGGEGEQRSLLSGFVDQSNTEGGEHRRTKRDHLKDLPSAPLAPVHQSGKSVGKEAEKTTSGFDKSEWWKAPEFVPRSLAVQISPDGGFITQQQQQQPGGTNVSASQHSASFISGGCGVDPITGQIPTAPSSTPISKTAPALHRLVTPPMPAPFSIPVQRAGLATTPGPALIPLPLAAPGWPVGATPNSAAPPPQFNPAAAASLAALHAQLTRVYANNPRVIRGQHATAYHNQKLQQLILQQHQNQLQQRHLPPHRQQQQRPPLIPFAPANTNPLQGPPASGANIPSGYTANVTTIDAGLGRQIPAIVLKRKRKKKNKKSVDTKQHQRPPNDQQKSEASSPPPSENAEPTDRPSAPNRDEAGGERKREGSEPDLTKIQHDATSTSAVCDVLIGTAAEHLVQQSCYYPNDLDLIQSANHCAMITGSCPDLSTDAAELANEANEIVSVMCKSNHVNPFLRDQDHEPESADCNFEQTEQPVVQYRIPARNGNFPFSQSVYGVDDFELDTNPVVRSTMLDLASDGMIRSKQVKELNRQVIKDMRLEEKLRQWRQEDWSEPELEEDDSVFERLLKNENARDQRQETNPGKGQKSLREELEEGLMIRRNRGAGEETAGKEESKRLLSSAYDDSDMDCISRALVHRTAIVHGSKKPGEMAKTELITNQGANAGSTRTSKNASVIPRATFVEADIEHDERMRITVNALDALDVDGAETLLSKSHLRSMAANGHHVQSLEDISDQNSKRRFSFPDSVPLVPIGRSRTCCALM